MEKGINHYILNKFGIEPRDTRSYSPLVLAYIGDGIYDHANVYDRFFRAVGRGRGNDGDHEQRLRRKGGSKCSMNRIPYITFA